MWLVVVLILLVCEVDVLYDAPRVDAAGVPRVDVVVHERREEVVRGGDGVKIAGEVEVDVLGGDHDRFAAAGGAPLDPEGGPERGFAEGQADLFADLRQPLGEADGRGGLAFARRRGRDRGDQDQLAPPGARLQGFQPDLGLVVAVGDEVFPGDSQVFRDFGDWAHCGHEGGLLGGD